MFWDCDRKIFRKMLHNIVFVIYNRHKDKIVNYNILEFLLDLHRKGGIEMEIKLKLGELLMKRGMTQRDLHEKTGIRLATISEMVTDTRSVYNRKHIATLVEFFNIEDMNELFELVTTQKMTQAR
jgi:putative transcriptional regulator